MFEHHHQPLLSRPAFLRRLARHALFALAMIAGSLLVGTLGYKLLAGLGWVDSIENAAMILGGMGPVAELKSDAAKLFAAPVGKEVADAAMQVLGGCGYCDEYKIERFYRDAKLLEIGGGTLESHQKNITKDLTKQVCG